MNPEYLKMWILQHKMLYNIELLLGGNTISLKILLLSFAGFFWAPRSPEKVGQSQF
jgi:hypothetical protein